jgi:hypothetical protein
VQWGYAKRALEFDLQIAVKGTSQSTFSLSCFFPPGTFINRKNGSAFWADQPLIRAHHCGAAQGKCPQDKQRQDHVNPFLHSPSAPFILWFPKYHSIFTDMFSIQEKRKNPSPRDNIIFISKLLFAKRIRPCKHL